MQSVIILGFLENKILKYFTAITQNIDLKLLNLSLHNP